MKDVQTPTANARKIYTIDAIPEVEEKQEELNRRLRKPGEAGCEQSNRNGASADSETREA